MTIFLHLLRWIRRSSDCCINVPKQRVVRVDTRLPNEAYYEALADAFVMVAINATPIAASGYMGWVSGEGQPSEPTLVFEILHDSGKTAKRQFDDFAEDIEGKNADATEGSERKRARISLDLPDVSLDGRDLIASELIVIISK
jgi:hypothetical protein